MCAIFLLPTLFIQIFAHIWARGQLGERQDSLVMHYLALPFFLWDLLLNFESLVLYV